MGTLRAVVRWVTRHRFWSGLIIAIILVVIIGTRFLVSRTDGTLSEPLKRGKIVESVYGIGTVTANISYQVKLGVISTINNLYVKEGDDVTKGQKLAEIDRIIFRAPFNSTVTFLPFKVGENVFPNVPILTLVDLLDRYLVVSLEQQGALRVKRGQKVKMSFDTMRERNYDGVVRAVYSNENNFLARIDISKLPPQILPGMNADVAVDIQEHDNVLLVPVAALEQGNTVWVKRGRGIPAKATIKTGIIDQTMAEVSEGDVRPGDRLLIRKKASP